MPKLTRRHAKFALAGVMLTLVFGGCGLKGPLYRPGENKEAAQPNSSPVNRKKSPFDRTPAPQAQKQPSSSAPTDTPATVDPDRPATSPPAP